MLKSAQSAWDYRQNVDGLPLFGPFWDRNAELPVAGGQDAQFVEGAVNSSSIPERDLSVQLSGWMLMEAAHAISANGERSDDGGGHTGMTEPGGWTPDEDTVERANLTRFMAWLAETGRGEFDDYQQLLAKSLDDIAWFWDAVWHFFDIRATTPAETVLASREMPGAQWFPGATLNYAVEAFRHETDEYPALVVAGEDGSTEWSWARLRQETAAFAELSAQARRQAGGPGRRIPAEHRRGRRRVPRGGQRRGDVGGVQPGPRRRRRGRPARPARTDGAGGQRRLGVRREAP